MTKCVYLVGCRAVGKSSIGVALARRLGFGFLDTDAMVVEKTGASVAIIVSEEGWAGFRKYEKQVLSELIGQERMVVATGGGAILHREIWQELKREGQVVWLTADIDVLCKRLERDRYTLSQRPSLTGKDICHELSDILKERSPHYLETADCIVDSGKLTIVEAVDSIVQACRSEEKE